MATPRKKPEELLNRSAADLAIGKRFVYRGARTAFFGKRVTAVKRDTEAHTIIIRHKETLHEINETLFPYLCEEIGE
jgi:hypothetical protein